MPIPDFVVTLREKIGHDFLPMAGVTAVVTRTGEVGDEVLLIQRSDNQLWTPITGILEPGEEPDVAALREIGEEAGVEAKIDRLVRVETTNPVTHANGDKAIYLDMVFACSHVSGEPHPADDEALDVRWWPINDDLPVVNKRFRRAIFDCVSEPRPVMFGAEGRTYQP